MTGHRDARRTWRSVLVFVVVLVSGLVPLPATNAQINGPPTTAPNYADGDYTGTISFSPPLGSTGLALLRDDLIFSLSDCVVTVAEPAPTTIPVTNCGYGNSFNGRGAAPFELPNGETCDFRLEGFATNNIFGLRAQGSAYATCPSGVWGESLLPSYAAEPNWTATAQPGNDYDGSYGGGYSGEWGNYVPPGQSKTVTGGLAFSVSGGSFTMTRPWAVTGTVSVPGGRLFFRTTSYSVIFPGGFLCTLTISGLITAAADGAAAGSWDGNCGSSGYQRGSWHASRGGSTDPDPTPTPTRTPSPTPTPTPTAPSGWDGTYHYPYNLRLNRGRVTSGSVNSLGDYDDVALTIKSAKQGRRNQAVDYDFFVSTPYGSLDSATSKLLAEVWVINTVRLQFWAYNWDQGKWLSWDPVTVPAGTGQLFKTGAPAAQYIDDDGEVLLGITWRQRGIFTHKIDQVVLSVCATATFVCDPTRE